MNSIINLTAILTNPKVDKDSKLKRICTLTTELIPSADRVSLWTFNQTLDAVTCDICFDENKSFTYGHRLTKKDFPEYFKSIIEANVIDAPYARSHPATACFTESYFKPLNIYSLLDYILHDDFNPSGIICCESVGKEVLWQPNDANILKKIARASSMHFKRTA